MSAPHEARPATSVIVPFAGSESAARSMLDGLRKLRLRPEDELIVVDNGRRQTVAGIAADPVRVISAEYERSSYHARNRGAEEARTEWLLFLDADCRPAPDLIESHFAPPLPSGVGIVAGAVRGLPGQRGLLPTWARTRNQLSEEHLVYGGGTRPYPATGTGNMLVRKSVWESLGGFHEGVRSGADVEFCWRVQEAGWTLEHRSGAYVHHAYGVELGDLVRQGVRHAAGRRWVNRRFRDAFAAPRPARDLTRSLGGALVWGATLRARRALFKLIDGIALGSGAWGWWLGRNSVRPTAERPLSPRSSKSLVVVTDAFPARSETFVYNEVLELIDQGWQVRVESLARPPRVERSVARRVRVDYFEDDSPRDKARDLIWLLARHPLRCGRDVRAQQRWRREEAVWSLAALAPAARRLEKSGERHLHAHFAAGGCLQAMRISRLCGTTYSLTAHAYDIFQHRRNLGEKLRAARFAAAECEYTAEALREIGGPAAARRVHRVATGTDVSRFHRGRPYGGGGRVLAIGRLVEKKGFEHLIRAGAILRGDPRVEGIAIAGEGPLLPGLRALRDELELGDFVDLTGALWGPEAVRDLLEAADLLVVPSVIASDGDRDALPLVAYEALAMEVPVVASDLVGLPELVRPPWGVLVPPGDEKALAAAISEVLSRSASDRAAMAAEGRAFVAERFDPHQEVERLAELFAGS